MSSDSYEHSHWKQPTLAAAINTQNSTLPTYTTSTHPVCLLPAAILSQFYQSKMLLCTLARHWVIGIPCGHAITAINTSKQAPVGFVLSYWSRQKWVATYDSAVPPITMDIVHELFLSQDSGAGTSAAVNGRRGYSSQSGRRELQWR